MTDLNANIDKAIERQSPVNAMEGVIDSVLKTPEPEIIPAAVIEEEKAATPAQLETPQPATSVEAEKPSTAVETEAPGAKVEAPAPAATETPIEEATKKTPHCCAFIFNRKKKQATPEAAAETPAVAANDATPTQETPAVENEAKSIEEAAPVISEETPLAEPVVEDNPVAAAFAEEIPAAKDTPIAAAETPAAEPTPETLTPASEPVKEKKSFVKKLKEAVFGKPKNPGQTAEEAQAAAVAPTDAGTNVDNNINNNLPSDSNSDERPKSSFISKGEQEALADNIDAEEAKRAAHLTAENQAAQ